MMKRCRVEEDREFDINNCLMLLTKVGKPAEETSFSGRVFACKTCNKEFSSFQALGGHRASHKKPKLTAADLFGNNAQSIKPKAHECSICGAEFAMGQALGGHMRRHRAAAVVEQSLESTSSDSHGPELLVPVMKKSSSKRVLCLDLNLNLTPFKNDLDLRLGNIITPVL